MTVKRVKNNLFNHYMINGKKNNLEIYKKKSPFSVTKRTIIINKKFLNSDSPAYWQISLANPSNMSKRAIHPHPGRNRMIRRQYDFGHRKLIFLLIKSVKSAFNSYVQSHKEINSPFSEQALKHLWSHANLLRLVHNKISAQHIVDISHLDAHPLTREGFLDHNQEFYDMTHASLGDNSLYTDAPHEAIFLGDYTEPQVLPTAAETFAHETWVIAQDISKMYKPKLPHTREYIWDHFERLYDHHNVSFEMVMQFPPGSAPLPYTQLALENEQLIQQALMSNNLDFLHFTLANIQHMYQFFPV